MFDKSDHSKDKKLLKINGKVAIIIRAIVCSLTTN